MPPRTIPIGSPPTDTASDDYKPKAISFVLAGGVMAGVIGPPVVIVTKDWWLPHLFAATFIAQSVLAALAGLVLTQLKSPPPMPREERAQIPAGRCRRSRGSRCSSPRSPAASSAMSS